MSHALTVAQVRQAVRDRIAGMSGWAEAAVPYQAFAAAGTGVPSPVTQPRGHLVFAVGILDTAPLGDRQKASVGTEVRSDVRVRFLHRAEAKDKLGSEDEAHDAAHDLVKRLMEQSTTWPGTVGLIVLLRQIGLQRSPSGEWYSVEVAFHVYHRLALQ